MPEQQIASIHDVARAAGVSIATVSNVYNDKGRVSEDTRRRVRAVGDRLDYQPNALGKALRTGRARVIGIAVTYRHSAVWDKTYLPYFQSIIAGAALAAVEHGYSIAAAPTQPDGTLVTELALDGVIVVDPVPGELTVENLLARGLAVVTDGEYRVPNAPDTLRTVSSDIGSGVAEMLDHLGSLVHPLVPGLFTGPRQDSFTEDTSQAFRTWCENHDLDPVVGTVGADQDPVVAAGAFLTGPGADVTAVHCLNETYCRALQRAAERLGRAPEALTLSVAGNAHSPTALDGVHYLNLDPVRTGAACAELLIALLEGGTPTSQVVRAELVPPRLR